MKVKKLFTALLIPFLVLVLVTMFSCAAFQDIVTPCYIDPEAAEYADANSTLLMPYTSLWDAKRIQRQMKRKNELNQRDLGRLLVDDASFYVFLAEGALVNIKSAEEFKGTMFSPTGPIGLLVPALAGLGIGAMAISKPGDKKKIVALEKQNGVGMDKPKV